MRDLRRAVDNMDLPAWGLGFAHLLAHWIATSTVLPSRGGARRERLAY